MKEEFEAKLFQNKNNKQFTLQLRIRSLNRELRKLLDNPLVIGLKLQIIEAYDKDTYPKPTTVVDRSDPAAVKQYNQERYIKHREGKIKAMAEYYWSHKEEISRKRKLRYQKNKDEFRRKARLSYHKKKEEKESASRALAKPVHPFWLKGDEEE